MPFKQFVKNIASHYPNYNAAELIKIVKNYEVVSFDIFDTLVKRSIGKPCNVFLSAAEEYNHNSGKKINRADFRTDRIAAEQKARKELCAEDREEVSLEQIYEYLPDQYSDSVKKKLCQAEIAAEISCCQANSELKPVYDYCVQSKKEIYIISDMYLPRGIIEGILRECGYTNYKKLYLSSEYQAQKRSGRLFERYIQENELKGKRCIHIGDDLKGDYLASRRCGIHRKMIARNPYRTRFTRMRSFSGKDGKYMRTLADIYNSCISKDWDDYYCFGFECFGTLLYGICRWIHEDAQKENISHLFFLSRDGYIIQRAYNELYGDQAIDNSYLHVSRRALIMAQYWMSPGLEAFQSSATANIVWTYENIAEQLGIDSTYALQKWKEAGLEASDYFYNHNLNKDKRVYLFFDKIAEIANENSLRCCQNLLDYLEQEGVKGVVAIIDMGWRGTIQKCMNKILTNHHKEVTIKGYYVGLMKNAATNMIASTYYPEGYIPNLAITMMFDFFFSAPEGSTKDYSREKDGRVYPQLYDCEYREEREIQFLNQIHRGALKFIHTVKDCGLVDDMNPNILSRNLLNSCRYPRKLEITLFGDVQFSDKSIYKMAAPQSLLYYFRNPKELKKDFWKSGWKIGFLKRLLKLPFPYFQCYKFLKYLTH